MTTKKILLMIGGVVVVLGFLVLCFVGAIVGFALYQVSHSEAAARARDYLSNNEQLKADIGPVKDFGSIVTGNISFHNNTGEATLHLKVLGERKTVNASVELTLRNRTWIVVNAYYVNSAGETVNLQNPYDTKLLVPLLIA
ncbi:MAG TPA: hypothetical protein VLB46_17785 [Pyrinomonadaceae bacterium]|nr:hypothetical protein [Pyrinomonadaceae bacterium]